ncbi:hypothetical protein MLD38_000038 [Melastoma candidum]|uniref:Uncharacterized protein n=1 Tax=Melastoma candidum TaxID=119954 RepID=A0ACB9SDP9_9MYRT|nr:hypothetical protein MLD38_000038 [Melastoma candidum]
MPASNTFQKRSSPRSKILHRYTKQSDISRSTLWFFEGTQKIMLYTERAHFYHRYKIVNLLEGSEEMTCSVLFSRFDHFRLERIVGSASAKRMVTSDKSVFVFC